MLQSLVFKQHVSSPRPFLPLPFTSTHPGTPLWKLESVERSFTCSWGNLSAKLTFMITSISVLKTKMNLFPLQWSVPPHFSTNCSKHEPSLQTCLPWLTIQLKKKGKFGKHIATLQVKSHWTSLTEKKQNTKKHQPACKRLQVSAKANE